MVGLTGSEWGRFMHPLPLSLSLQSTSKATQGKERKEDAEREKDFHSLHLEFVFGTKASLAFSSLPSSHSLSLRTQKDFKLTEDPRTHSTFPPQLGKFQTTNANAKRWLKSPTF